VISETNEIGEILVLNEINEILEKNETREINEIQVQV